jgi:putative transcriptional regulator
MQNIIRETRKKQKLSQDDLARICHVSRQTINAIENDKYDAELSLAFKLANALDCRVDDLFVYEVRSKESDTLWCEKYKCILWQTVGTQNQKREQV